MHMEEYRAFLQNVADEISMIFQPIKRSNLQKLLKFLLRRRQGDIELFDKFLIRIIFILISFIRLQDMHW